MADAIRRWLGIPRRDALAVGAVVFTFFVLRVLAIRTTPVVYFDSAEYRHLHWWGGRRPFTVPLLFWFAPSDRWRVLEQVVISTAAWITLALVVVAGINDRRVRIATVAVVLSIGLTTQITNWDSAILSDSIAISLTVFLVAAWVALHRTRTPWTVSAVIVTTVLWTFTRELHVYVGGLLALGVAIAVLVRRAGGWWLVLTLGLLIVAGLGVLEARSNTETSVQNLAGVIGARVLPDPDVREWFEQAGMPFMPQLRPGQQHPDKELLAIPEFTKWAEKRGWLVYARFLVTHPDQAIDGPYQELLEERPAFGDKPSGRAVLLSPTEAYGTSRPVLPPVVDDVLFGPGRTGALLALGAIVLTASILVHAQTGGDPRRHVPVVIVGLSLLYVFMAWHGSVFEPGRHSMPGAVAIRLGTALLAAVVADRALTRSPAPADNLVA